MGSQRIGHDGARTHHALKKGNDAYTLVVEIQEINLKLYALLTKWLP